MVVTNSDLLESADLSAEDYNILFSSIALQSTNKIQKLLEEISDKRKSNESIHKASGQSA